MPFCSAYPNRRLANAIANYYVALVHLFFFAYSFLYFVSSNSQTSPTCSPKNPSEEFENHTAASSTLSDPNCDIESLAIQRFREIFAPILTYKGIALGSALVAWIPSWYLLERCPYTVIWTTGYWAKLKILVAAFAFILPTASTFAVLVAILPLNKRWKRDPIRLQYLQEQEEENFDEPVPFINDMASIGVQLSFSIPAAIATLSILFLERVLPTRTRLLEDIPSRVSSEWEEDNDGDEWEDTGLWSSTFKSEQAELLRIEKSQDSKSISI